MNVTIRELKPGDGAGLAASLNNPKVQANLRDGLPFPYTAEDGEEYIKIVQAAEKDSQYVNAVCLDG
jgi:hypothetical protein